MRFRDNMNLIEGRFICMVKSVRRRNAYNKKVLIERKYRVWGKVSIGHTYREYNRYEGKILLKCI